MEQILSVSPEFTEVITWVSHSFSYHSFLSLISSPLLLNLHSPFQISLTHQKNDAGESHYIGPCWAEGLTAEILQYGNSDTIPHTGWQSLISSFIKAFKAGSKNVSAMTPTNGKFAGALWYRGVLTSCSGDKPRGAGAARDAVNYAVVLPAGSSGHSIRVTSGGQLLAMQSVSAGLKYNSVPGMKTGAQKIELVDGSGNVVASASGSVNVGTSPTNGFCNYNYYVSGLQ